MMRRLLVALVGVLVVLAGCTAASDPEPHPSAGPTPSASAAPAVTFASVGVDWPRADGTLDMPAPPEAPEGYGDDVVGRMGDLLVDWATATTVDPDVWHSGNPVDRVADVLPPKTAAALRRRTAGAVSTGLAVANVFSDDVTVVGEPAVTTAWRMSTRTDGAGREYLLLELQTRAAYEVRDGDDGPTRVIGVLRVHGLSAYPGTTDDFGVSGGWQEFGAADCALAVDDDLVPDTDLAETARDLGTFVKIGDATELTMPPLEAGEQVDSDYLQRCRNGDT